MIAQYIYSTRLPLAVSMQVRPLVPAVWVKLKRMPFFGLLRCENAFLDHAKRISVDWINLKIPTTCFMVNAANVLSKRRS